MKIQFKFYDRLLICHLGSVIADFELEALVKEILSEVKNISICILLIDHGELKAPSIDYLSQQKEEFNKQKSKLMIVSAKIKGVHAKNIVEALDHVGSLTAHRVVDIFKKELKFNQEKKKLAELEQKIIETLFSGLNLPKEDSAASSKPDPTGTLNDQLKSLYGAFREECIRIQNQYGNLQNQMKAIALKKSEKTADPKPLSSELQKTHQEVIKTLKDIKVIA